MMPRGSRKHVLDWTDGPRFIPEILGLARPAECRVTADSHWMPMGAANAQEARLETFGRRVMANHPAWPALRSWWLRHPNGANTPNWDIALSCDIDCTPGLVLVEAKANLPELGEAGKRSESDASSKSADNHDQIAQAIEEARTALAPLLPGISISRDKHYQLSNRVAFAWKLASLGIPTVVIYLGFTGDTDIANVGAPFADDADWQKQFRAHFGGVCPLLALDRRWDVGPASFWLLSRSRAVQAALPSAPTD